MNGNCTGVSSGPKQLYGCEAPKGEKIDISGSTHRESIVPCIWELFTTKAIAKANNSSFFAHFAAEKKCPTGWQEWSGYCYMLVQQEETYGGAKAFCQVILLFTSVSQIMDYDQ